MQKNNYLYKEVIKYVVPKGTQATIVDNSCSEIKNLYFEDGSILKLGENVTEIWIEKNSRVTIPGNVSGNEIILGNNCNLNVQGTVTGKTITQGNNSEFTIQNHLQNPNQVNIHQGNNCTIVCCNKNKK